MAGLAAILAGMEVTGLGWCGTRTEHDEQLAQFYEHVLGLRPVHAEPGLRVFELPDGWNVEVFGPSTRAGSTLTAGRSSGSRSATFLRPSGSCAALASNCLVSRGPPGSISEDLTATCTNWPPAET
jgi:hypothetical protein